MKSTTNRHTVMAAVLAVGLLLAACGGHDVGDPAAAIEAYISEYNAGDLDGVMAMFSEDAVLTGHPFAARATGRAAIRSVHADEVGGPGKYTISNLEASGSTVTWDHVWAGERDGGAFAFCVEGHSATVDDGRITSWSWPDTDFECQD